ncbi:thioredoxin family protein [Mesonia ostreae]|uniref:Thioredoxin family protein n=1 Tax=Mesonia ostreae TaxID=861110 RepID=A0ABU2KI95_9FLAO|nr:thioredoxin family protein [Mesonia ostreae]MDT0294430.1 thioredoxin family protein [Mesonia ostreae]
MINYSKYLILVLFLGWFLPLKAQQKDAIQWKTWPELEQAFKKEPKPVFMFFHAKWCAYCKKIQREVFSNIEVIQKINKEYYAVEMDVERTDTIQFDGIEFVNRQPLKKRNGVHDFHCY